MASYEQALARRQSGESDFPMFDDGDVLVVLSANRQYQLHARTLRMHSDLFRRLLAEEHSTKLSSRAKKEGVKVQFRIELQLPRDDAHGVGRFVLRVSSNNISFFLLLTLV
jgi:hypothetical protein